MTTTGDWRRLHRRSGCDVERADQGPPRRALPPEGRRGGGHRGAARRGRPAPGLPGRGSDILGALGHGALRYLDAHGTRLHAPGREGVGHPAPRLGPVRGRPLLRQGPGGRRAGHAGDGSGAAGSGPGVLRPAADGDGPLQAGSHRGDSRVRPPAAVPALQRPLPHRDRPAAVGVLRRDPGLPRGPRPPGPLRRRDAVGPATVRRLHGGDPLVREGLTAAIRPRPRTSWWPMCPWTH